MFRGLIRARHWPKRDGQAVPTIDGNDCECEVCQFLLREMLPDLLEDLVGNVSVGDAGDRLGPGQGRPLALAEKRSLMPRGQSMESLLGFAVGSGVFGMHVETESTNVYLRGPGLDKFQQGGFKTTVSHIMFEPTHGLVAVRSGFHIIHSL